MAARTSLLRAPLGGSRRVCGTGLRFERAWIRTYQVSSIRRQLENQPSGNGVGNGLAPHLVASPKKKVAFQDISSGSVKPAFGKQITIELDGKPAIFDSIFLRDSCKCPRCVNPSSTQKNFETAAIPASIEGSCQVTTELEDHDCVLIDWKNDIPDWPEGHQTALPLDFLRGSLEKEGQVKPATHELSTRVLWETETMSKDIEFIDYNTYMSDERALYRVLQLLYTHGLVFLKNVPDTISTDSALSVAAIAERIGPIRHTFYGRTWDVRSIPNAKNVAYTHVFLGLHMDLCYMDLTPHLQFLHSMRARAPGGESMFSDSFYAAEVMRRESPDLFEALRTFGVTYNYFNDGMAYRQTRPTIELVNPDDPSSAIKLINWSPPFQGPFAQDIGSQDSGKALRTYHAAAQRFAELVNDPGNMYEYRMNEGECVMFDNRRVLHARRAFEADKGERWLKGVYLDRDVYASKLAVLEDKFKAK